MRRSPGLLVDDRKQVAGLQRGLERGAHDRQMAELGRLHAGLPDDLLNFQYDAVACAVALGWPGAIVEQARLDLVREGELVRFRPGAAGRPTRVLADLDSGGFADHWLQAVEAAQRPA